jgi:hypothetical protein
VVDKMVFKKVHGKGRKCRTEREGARSITQIQLIVETEMEAEESATEVRADEVRKILMKAKHGNRKTLPKEKHKKQEQKMIPTTEKAAIDTDGSESALIQIQK